MLFSLKVLYYCMDRIFANGAVTHSALSLSPTSSFENWSAMLLGATPNTQSISGVYGRGHKNMGDVYPSVFKIIRDKMPDARLSSFVHWNVINRVMVEDGIGVNLANGGDSELCDIIVEEVAKKPTFLFIQLDDIDDAGHTYAFGSEKFLESVTVADSYVGKIYDAYVDNGIIDETLFIAIADHGGVRTGHGGYTETERFIFLAAAGKNVPKGEMGIAYTRDIAAIVLYALGIDVPEYDETGFSSQVPDGIFAETFGSYRAVEAKTVGFQVRETPEFKSEKGLANYISEDRIKLAIFFDGEVCDATGNNVLEEFNEIEYSDGVYGKSGIIGKNGHVTVKDFKLGSGNFTVSFWAKIDPTVDEGMSVVCNKNWFWRNRGDNGFGIAFRAHDVIFNISNGEHRGEIIVGFPLDIADGWINVTCAVDKENRKITVYYNFKKVYQHPLHECLVAAGDTDLLFNVGNDGLGTFSNEVYKLSMEIDDFIIFGDALSENDVNKLSEYYGI